MDRKPLNGTASVLADLRRTLGHEATLAEAEFLLRVAGSQGLSQRELCDLMKLPTSNIWSYCDDLSEEKRDYDGDLKLGHGLIEKRVDPDNRMRLMVVLTTKGERYTERLSKLVRGVKR